MLLDGLAAAGGLWWPCVVERANRGGRRRAYGGQPQSDWRGLAGCGGSDCETAACHGRVMSWSMVGDCEGLAGSFMALCEELGEARRMGALGSCEGVVGVAITERG